MGDPRKARKTFSRPRRIWTSDQLSAELYVIGSYGLRNKKELWKAQTEVAGFRNQARALLALPAEDRHSQEIKLLKYLGRLGLIDETATLDDILNLKIEHLLERRLQTMIMRKIDTKSPYTARQIVVHGHVSIGDRFVNLPGHIVRREEENMLLVHLDLSKSSSSSSPSSASAPALTE
jgi:small subunit ribosomal protein S4